jgi:hypothetical protein
MAGYTAQVKLTWKRHRLSDYSGYYWLLTLRIGKASIEVAEVSDDDGSGFLWLGGNEYYFKPMPFDKAEEYVEKRVIKYFGLKENTDD